MKDVIHTPQAAAAMKRLRQVVVVVLIAAAVVGYCILVLLALYVLSQWAPGGGIVLS